MRTSSSPRLIGAVIVATLLVAAQAQAIIAYDFPSGLTGNQNGVPGLEGPWILGNVFTVGSQDINVTAVGAFVDGASLGADVPVAIYSLSGSTWSRLDPTFVTFLAGTTPTSGSAAFQNLSSPYALLAGSTYAIVAANYGAAAGTLNNFFNAGLPQGSTVPGFAGSPYITMGSPSALYAQNYSALDPTLPTVGTGTFGGGTIPDWAGATFVFDLTPVPEASAFGAAGVGLLGLVYIGRFACLRRKMKLA